MLIKSAFIYTCSFPKVIKLETARISDGNTDVWKHNGIYNQLALLEQAVQKNLESAFNNGVMAANIAYGNLILFASEVSLRSSSREHKSLLVDISVDGSN
ncbi:unnamed protein product [Onchocerca flexuosa]|uniref:Heavy metal-binding domain-containing protein n=1 Tax=Onchocerca flexuosa TaxID=387005 RepID=A0A183HBG6_9BILA|nr:unnamed protein product [Onchocerca flexuosa]